MKLNIYILIFFSIFIQNIACSQHSNINWLSWEQAIDQSQKSGRKVMVHIYTEGCNPCKHMDNTTFITQDVVNMINQNFYSVKLDAKSKQALKYHGKNLEYKCNSGLCFHELAWELTGGSLSFPSVIILDENLASIGAIPDYKNAEEFLLYVEYYGYGYSSKMPFSKYPNYKKRHANRN